jgi:predicted RND superfamily exporter protein
MNKILKTVLLWIVAIIVVIAILWFLFKSPFSPIKITQQPMPAPPPEMGP